MSKLPQAIKEIIQDNINEVFADDLISRYESNKTPVRYFMYDEDIYLEDCDSHGDYRECTEQVDVILTDKFGDLWEEAKQ